MTAPKIDTDEKGFLTGDGQDTAPPAGDAPKGPASAPPPPSPPAAAPAPGKRGRKSNEERARIAAQQIEAGGAAQVKKDTPRAAKSAASRKSYTQADMGAMAQQLQGLHMMAAATTGLGELQLSDKESIALAGAIVNISEQYDLSIDGKTGALIQLLGTAAMIYAPRFLSVNARIKAAKAARNSAAPTPTAEQV